MADIRITEGREAERRHLNEVVKPAVWGTNHEDRLDALDGLDIAQEMAGEFALALEDDPHPTGYEVLAKWDKWQANPRAGS